MSYQVDSASRVQTLNEAVCFLNSANTFGKDMNQTILPSAADKKK